MFVSPPDGGRSKDLQILKTLRYTQKNAYIISLLTKSAGCHLIKKFYIYQRIIRKKREFKVIMEIKLLGRK